MYGLKNISDHKNENLKSDTVYIRKPDRPRFERSSLGHILGSVFGYRLKAGPDFFLTSLDRFVMNKIFCMTLINKTV
jgi:hypothetical protein